MKIKPEAAGKKPQEPPAKTKPVERTEGSWNPADRETAMVQEATPVEPVVSNGQLVRTSDRALSPRTIGSYPLPMPDGRTERLLTSFNPNNAEDAVKVFDAINSEDYKGDWAK